jgi:hypothetical protein
MRRNVRRLNREIGVHTAAIPAAQSSLLLTYQPQKPSDRKVQQSPRNPQNAPHRSSFKQIDDSMLVDSSSMFQNSNSVPVSSYLQSNNLLHDDDDSSVDSDASNNMYASTGFNSLNSTSFGISPAGLSSSAFDFPDERKLGSGSLKQKKGVRKAVNLSGNSFLNVLLFFSV